jgi:hypothetical protein
MFLAGLLVISAAAFSPVTTDRITITGDGITAEIADKMLVRKFRFGPGPGNFMLSGTDRIPLIHNWVADWSKPTTEPDVSMTRYIVQFHLTVGSSTRQTDEHREYQVTFAYSKETGTGYIYLPGQRDPHYRENVRLLSRGPAWDGHWFEAVSEWTEAAVAAISRARR